MYENSVTHETLWPQLLLAQGIKSSSAASVASWILYCNDKEKFEEGYAWKSNKGYILFYVIIFKQ